MIMKKILVFLLCAQIGVVFCQKDSLEIGSSYWEDQLYFGVTFNELINQPSGVLGSGFSFGVNMGYIRDISLVKSGKLALGVGIGYAYDAFRHGFKLYTQNDRVVVEVDGTVQSRNDLRMHSLEFPLEFRWRTSTANKYKFWRIYTGAKFSYHLKNAMNYTDNTVVTTYNNVARFNKLQCGLTLSAGYSSFNFNVYYGLTPILKDASIGTTSIGSRVLRLGMVFYLL